MEPEPATAEEIQDAIKQARSAEATRESKPVHANALAEQHAKRKHQDLVRSTIRLVVDNTEDA